ncbi:bone morphogenetic protein 2-like [Mizuhopecten yessoensis]|uniref:Bone morphogenetic protein 2 n=1 Tax=Mizuhopecten yessoensis TaxID=6573 RepID=A0A210PQ13_MIZYE|nr:bone morphogenetic protein 2-like [Mizuhopecten yessoensis]OWF38590.1 Bone morphogenetic protein 2 [Mizuhopecten yessoensis]
MILYVVSRTVVLTVLLVALHLTIVDCKPALSASQQVSEAEKEIDISNLRIEAFKQSILEQIGDSLPSNVSNVTHSIETKRQKIREFRDYLRSKNDMQHIPDKEEMESESKRVRRTYKGDYKQQRSNPTDLEGPVLFYNIQETLPKDIYRELVVFSATLQLFKKQTNTSASNKTQQSLMNIKVFNVERNENLNLVKGKQISSKTIDVSISGWEAFDISAATQNWIDNPQSNHGLLLSSDTHNITQIVSFAEDTLMLKRLHNHYDEGRDVHLPKHSSDYFIPLLKLDAEERPILKRVKRQAGRRDCTQGDGEDRCCRFRTQINFRDIGWNWVIAPTDYEAFHCEGTCPDRFKMANTFTGIKSTLHKMDPSRFSAPCCIPSSFKPLTILHEDAYNNLVFTDFADMVVQDCKCA